mmetsp:Transcript_63129/g.92564  ORF Transcript_63129/g.92564 Transcript_63129/m.92564 type:complete len:94 (+) Transcript_63129:324-605(+)
MEGKEGGQGENSYPPDETTSHRQHRIRGDLIRMQMMLWEWVPILGDLKVKMIMSPESKAWYLVGQQNKQESFKLAMLYVLLMMLMYMDSRYAS